MSIFEDIVEWSETEVICRVSIDRIISRFPKAAVCEIGVIPGCLCCMHSGSFLKKSFGDFCLSVLQRDGQRVTALTIFLIKICSMGQ